MTKMTSTPIYGKNQQFKNVLLQNQKAADLGTWYVGPTKFVQMMILGWPWPT